VPRQPKPAPDPHAAWLAGLHPAVRMLAEWEGWEKINGAILVVACSGGRDSVALAHAAHELLTTHSSGIAAYVGQRYRVEGGFALPQLVLWHFDHGLRPESGEDAAFVANLASRLGVPSLIDEGHLTLHPEFSRTNTAALARQERYKALKAAQMRLQSGREPKVALVSSPASRRAFCLLAQHEQDQAETVLFNLSRGTGLFGLLGMGQHLDRFIHRPWRRLPAAEIAAYSQQHCLQWREDPTNADMQRARARIRHAVLPELTQVNSKAIQHIAQLSFDMEEMHGWLKGMEPPGSRYLNFERCLPLLDPCAVFATAHRAEVDWRGFEAWMAFGESISGILPHKNRETVQRVRAWLRRPQRPLQFGDARLERVGDWLLIFRKRLAGRQTEVAADMVERRFNLPIMDNRQLVRRVSLRVYGSPRPYKAFPSQRRVPVATEMQTLLRCLWEHQAGNYERGWKAGDLYAPEAKYRSACYSCCLPTDVQLPLAVRAWRLGDRIEVPIDREAHKSSRKKLSDIFINAKVPRPLRARWIVLVDANDSVLWVPGLADGVAMQRAKQHGVGFEVKVRPDQEMVVLAKHMAKRMAKLAEPPKDLGSSKHD
jgi:tRNA(Ile)-lysidine synthetase-like protein